MPDRTSGHVRPHNRAAAAIWDAGGPDYDAVSFAISDALAHAAQRLAPPADSRVLDIATGTGWTARNVARMGASVTAVDIAPTLLEAARALSGHMRPSIEFQLADAEALPFADGAFDAVISTFGVMFATDHHSAAGEIARVCRPGGDLVLATWAPDGAVARFFEVMASHSDAPPPARSPLVWGDPDHVSDLLGDAFELRLEHGVNNAYHPDIDAIWNWYRRGFGPLRALYDSLDDTARAALKRDIDAYHVRYMGEAGLHVERQYLVILGRRR